MIPANRQSTSLSSVVEKAARPGDANIITRAFEGADVRVMLDEDGAPWFAAADVCRSIDVGNPSQALARLDDDERTLISNEGGGPGLNFVSEAGLYSLVLGSRKPEARRFKRWVTHEVLPSIRRTGSYGATDPMAVLADPAAMRGLLLTYTERVLALEAKVAEVAPKAEALDRIATRAEGSMCVTDAAKALQVRPKDLFAWLQSHEWIYRRAGGKNWLGYQNRIQQGLLEHKVTAVLRGDGTEKITEQVLVTAKGLAKLANLVSQQAA